MNRLVKSFVSVVQSPLPRPAARALPERDEGAAAPPREELPPIAVFVAHGMGQQVPFQTLDEVATALRTAQKRAKLEPAPVEVRQIQNGDQRIARAETTLVRPDGKAQEVHLYEAYWAPLTEGRISLHETFGFLWRAGLAGAGRSLAGSWWRMMFGQKQTFRLSLRTAAAFMVALLVLGSLLLMNGVIVATTANRLLSVAVTRWPSDALFADLTADFLACLGLSVVLGAGIAVVNVLRRVTREGHVTPAPSLAIVLGWFCVWGIVAVIVLTGGLVASHILDREHGFRWAGTWLGNLVSGLAVHDAPPVRVAGAVGIWLLFVAVSAGLRWFIQQYMGDVAIYVSSHTVNRFHETRDQIQEAINRVTRFVYEARDEAGAPLYEQVIAIGHSLGSVIVYDAVNAMIRRDLSQGSPLRVVERTALLVTSGSPLDKTAFIFRNQSKDVGDIREALAQSMQPMISSYDTRPRRWVNLFSKNDWICGSLQYYDDGARPEQDPQHVQNVEDRQATTPLLAHNQYWNGPIFGDLVYRALVPAGAPAP